MTSLKRKASQHLIKISGISTDETEEYHHTSKMPWWHHILFPYRYFFPPASSQTQQRTKVNGALINEIEVAQPSFKHTTPDKRRKYHEQNQYPQRARSMADRYRRRGRGSINFDGCSNDDDAKERRDKFWLPKEPEFLKKKARHDRSLKSEPAPAENISNAVLIRRYSDPSTIPSQRVLPTRSDTQAWNFNGSIISTTGGSFAISSTSFYRNSTAVSRQRDDDNDDDDINQALARLLTSDPAHELPISESKRDENQVNREQRKRRIETDAVLRARRARLERERRSPSAELIQPLSSNWEQAVAKAYGSSASTIITKSIGGTELRVKDFATLLGQRAWLNDEIINAYIEWVVEAANEATIHQASVMKEDPPIVPRFIAHNSFFYNNIRQKGPSSTDRLMKRKKAAGVALMQVDSIFIPICSGNHWTIGVVRPIAKTIEYFDSMGGSPVAFFKNMRVWLDHQLGKAYVADEWCEPNSNCAHQSNGYDCGVFVCTNAYCVATGLDTSCYTEHDMTTQRYNIAAVLLNRGFHKDFAWAEGRELV